MDTDHGVVFFFLFGLRGAFLSRNAENEWRTDVNFALVWFVYVYADTKLEFIRRYCLCGFLRAENSFIPSPYPPHGKKAVFKPAHLRHCSCALVVLVVGSSGSSFQ